MGDSQVGWDAGRAIGDIVATDAILTKQNHANIRVGVIVFILVEGSNCFLQILYAQKYFSGVLPRILVGAQSCGNLSTSAFRPYLTVCLVPYERSSHLVALASLIKAMPRIAYVQEIPSVCNFDAFILLLSDVYN